VNISWNEDPRPIRAIGVFQDAEIDDERWPATIPAVREFLRVARNGAPYGGWEFDAGVTFLVGENGTGKSTLLEGIAEAAGLPAQGGTQNGGPSTHRSESPLGQWLKVSRGLQANKGGFFLRAETMHQYYTWLADGLDGNQRHPDAGREAHRAEYPDAELHRLSHGESFNDLLARKLDPERFGIGLALLDEPEAALSFDSQLRWLVEFDQMRTRGTQVICATHSPVLTALPGATVLELGDWGIQRTTWAELDLVQQHRIFLEAPERYLRYLLAD
jgi:predicted ATPase